MADSPSTELLKTKCERCEAEVTETHVKFLDCSSGVTGCYYKFVCYAEGCRQWLVWDSRREDPRAHWDYWEKWSRSCGCSDIGIAPALEFKNCNCGKFFGHVKDCPAYDPNIKLREVEIGAGGFTGTLSFGDADDVASQEAQGKLRVMMLNAQVAAEKEATERYEKSRRWYNKWIPQNSGWFHSSDIENPVKRYGFAWGGKTIFEIGWRR